MPFHLGKAGGYPRISFTFWTTCSVTVKNLQHHLAVLLTDRHMCRVWMEICGQFMPNILQIKQFMYHSASAQNTVIDSYETGKLKMKFLH